MPSDDPRDDQCLHKTKLIQFLGRTTPIILQNENGPCPLLSICNVLLLKNNLNLSPDLPEVSQQKLLSLVAERLIDANSNFEDKDPDYVQNQQQNVSDALELLPQLTTGIDVNLKFTGIRDFEFTPECAIFDLLDIPLYHGWIMDPLDLETSNAIRSKSYNRLMSELVSLETRATNDNDKSDFVDLSAATKAAIGIPSPSLSRGRSFDESPRCAAEDGNNIKNGNLEENEALLMALNLSEDPCSSSSDASDTPIAKEHVLTDCQTGVETCPLSSMDLERQATSDAEQNGPLALPLAPVTPNDCENQTSAVTSSESVSSTLTSDEKQECHINETRGSNDADHVPCADISEKSAAENVVTNESGSDSACDKTVVNDNTAILFEEDTKTSISPDSGSISTVTDHMLVSGSSNGLPDNSTSTSTIDAGALSCKEMDAEDSNLVIGNTESDSSRNVVEVKGEEFIQDSGKTILGSSEPIYEGEAVLSEQVDHVSLGGSTFGPKDELTPTQGYLVQNFLRTNASQLTIHGLFCLQEGLKERELCVFFRNNHFNTMFKYEGELYLLATDQGYISQPDLVWEKLNEVNGNTVFMTSNFKEFKIDSHDHSETWNEQNVMASTADYLASVDNAADTGSNFSSDLQLAIALQQQEFEQQQQPPPQPQLQLQQQQAPTNIGSRLVPGPQVRRNSDRSSSSSSSARQEAKSKEKCCIM